jgi:hypothetical protein
MTETVPKPAVHDQVLVECEIDGNVVGLRAVIVNVMPTTLWLGLARPNPHLQDLRPNQPLHLTFRQGGSAMVAASTFISHLGASRSRLFSIEWPADVRMVQRRAHLRLDTECRVDYTVLNQSDAGVAGRTGRGTTRNLSAGGAQFLIHVTPDDTVAAGDELELRISLGTSSVPAEGEVVRVEEALDAGPGRRSRAAAARPVRLVAVRFVSISEVAQDRIVRHIFALQRVRRAAVHRRE